jgi:hypothetical protein
MLNSFESQPSRSLMPLSITVHGIPVLPASFVYPPPSALCYPSALMRVEDTVVKPDSPPPPLALIDTKPAQVVHDKLHIAPALPRSQAVPPHVQEPEYRPKRTPVFAEKPSSMTVDPVSASGMHNELAWLDHVLIALYWLHAQTQAEQEHFDCLQLPSSMSMRARRSRMTTTPKTSAAMTTRRTMVMRP